MTLTVKQGTVKQGNSASSLTTDAITTTSGNLLVVCVSCFGNHLGTLSATVTDSKGNTWAVAVASTGGTQGWAGCVYAANCLGGSGHTFTITGTGSDFFSIAVLEITGTLLSSPLGSTNSASVASLTHTSGSVTAGATDEIAVGFGAVSRSTEGTPVITGDGATWWRLPPLIATTLEGEACAWRVLPAGTSDSFTYVVSSSFAETALVATFKGVDTTSTDPGIANVKSGTTYTINGSALTGTLGTGGGAPVIGSSVVRGLGRVA